jgi:hypothetical protein
MSFMDLRYRLLAAVRMLSALAACLAGSLGIIGEVSGSAALLSAGLAVIVLLRLVRAAVPLLLMLTAFPACFARFLRVVRGVLAAALLLIFTSHDALLNVR